MALVSLSRFGAVGRDVLEPPKLPRNRQFVWDPQLPWPMWPTVPQTWTDWNIKDGEKSYGRAIAIDSRCTLALVGLSQVMISTARLNEGLAAAGRVEASAVQPACQRLAL